MGDRLRRLGTVRVRTTLGATIIVGIALATAGLVLVSLLRRSLTHNVQTAAELRAQDVVSLLESGEAPETLAVDSEETSLVQVLDRSGAVLAASSNIEGEPQIADLRPGEARTLRELPLGDGEPYRVVARTTGDSRFVVLVARSLELVGESTSVVQTLLLAGIPALLLLVAGTTWVIVGRALGPVEGIRRQVAAISASELRRRVPEPGGEDEIARLARTMNAMLDRLERSRDRQQRFISDASHELRSPIATIRHQLETALAHPDSASVDRLGPDLLAEDIRMERLVEDLLLLARSDEDTVNLNRRPVDLDDLLLEEAARLRQRGRVRVDTAGVSAGRVSGDPSQLGRLIRNLLDNAERHARSTVSLGLQVRADEVVMTVADDGDGVPADARMRIFERFTRLDDARARGTGGAGLGLAIVAEVARAHGGSVHVDGEAGARFVVVLPGIDTD